MAGTEHEWSRLDAEPGLCAMCRHARLNVTRRGTAYLRCTRAAWDDGLPRYPRLPVVACPGVESATAPPSSTEHREVI